MDHSGDVNLTTQIVTQPISLATCAGSNVNFSVNATGAGLTYLWTNGSTTSNNLTSTLGSYRVTISGSCGAPVVSNTVSLTSLPSPIIVTQPVSQTTCAGLSAGFSVTALGANLSYQWSNGATSQTMNTNVAGNYNVTVRGCSIPAISNTVTFTTTPGIAIVSQPLSVSSCTGAFASFSVSATGSGLTYFWNNGATSSSISTNLLGIYRVTVAGCGIPVTSNAATLSSLSGTAITNQPISQSVFANTPATFSVSAVGVNLGYTWSNGLSTTNTMSTSIAGAYRVTVSGTCGNVVSNTVNLTSLNSANFFVTDWNLSIVGSGATQLSLGVGTSGVVSYQ